jgi:hypothetical protein
LIWEIWKIEAILTSRNWEWCFSPLMVGSPMVSACGIKMVDRERDEGGRERRREEREELEEMGV